MEPQGFTYVVAVWFDMFVNLIISMTLQQNIGDLGVK